MSVTTRCILRSHQSIFFMKFNQLKICIAVIFRNLIRSWFFLKCKHRKIDTPLFLLFRSSFFIFSFTSCSRVHHLICITIVTCTARDRGKEGCTSTTALKSFNDRFNFVELNGYKNCGANELGYTCIVEP